jgi:hypothetical protein
VTEPNDPVSAPAYWEPPRYEPRVPGSVTVARVFLGIQTALWAMFLVQSLVGMLGSGWIRAWPETVVCGSLFGSLLSVTIRLGRGRRPAWMFAVSLQALLAAGYAWLVYILIFGYSLEGLAMLSGIVIGPPLVASALPGLFALLGRQARAYCLQPAHALSATRECGAGRPGARRAG